MEKAIVYNEDKMIRLIEDDKDLMTMFKNMINMSNNRKDIIEVLFNNAVLDSHEYRNAYAGIQL